MKINKYILISEYGDVMADTYPCTPEDFVTFSSVGEAEQWMKENNEGGVAYLVPLSMADRYLTTSYINEDDFIDEDDDD